MTDNDGQFTINDEMKINCKSLCEKIRKALKEYILGNLKHIWKRDFVRVSHSSERQHEEISSLVLKNCFQSDREFLNMFVETQMFTTYIEENFL
jgi:2-hydroxy-3-keto-5-methylthiopentenyl-1-phosphate phosphatase